MAEAKSNTKKTTKKAGRLAILAAMGPGLLTAMAGNDAGGIATYSSTGATYGYGMLWTVPLMCVLLIVAQETAARMGCATGKGFAALIREQFGVRVSAIAMLALIISNFTVTLSEFAGIASSMELFGIPLQVSVPIAGIATWLLTQSGSYHRVEKILLALSCVFLTYIVSGFISNPDWGLALKDTVIPQFSSDPGYVSLLVANVGTTISPYMLFMVSSNVVEKNLKGSDIPGQRADNVSGVIAAEITTWFIVLTTGTVLYPAGVTVNSAADAAQALVPLAGQYASALFAAGLAGASFLAACVLPSITASAVCEAFGWERGVDRSWNEAPAYRAIITGITILSAGIVLIPNVDLFGVMMLAQVINGVLLPVLMVCMVLIANDKRVMGQYANGRVWTALTWFTIVVVIVLTIIMFVLQAMGL
ncbi:Nramp family divalent metal transporter [Tractidigestivibacter montrealensis]|jgi:NRAMP (natural resistance-associated macrophage protein)-like metal ion transporter|uniref:Nramp family divalent metal transporter n=1 Tax=Tractidigestivibacter montrealensis TaxID=2972466 RepID=A0ABT1ZAM1_9ACTN|nr:Nramp family divalent metal transporter [Tractidigestivibacter montrealensis]MCR9037257.1 Nramp family divalent metal transporter [Tractidigestivibacter montrealensis]